MPARVRSEHRPTLPELVGPRGRRLLLATLGAVALLAAVLAGTGATSSGVRVVREAPVAFNFRHADTLRAVAPRTGELLRLERENERGLFVQSFAVLPLELPAYRGDVGGLLPVLAEREIAALARRYEAFELVREGKARINFVAGYTVAFRARLGERRLYGRLTMLPEPVAAPRRGVRLLMESTPSAGVNDADDVGARGLNKTPYRSFRFGTEGP